MKIKGWHVVVFLLSGLMAALMLWSWPVWSWVVSGEKTIWLLLQNSQEIRATGGFLGSYATVKTNGWKILEVKIDDIYTPDGQMAEEVPAPAGVKEYLSEGGGWRLPDGNWQSDFPTAVADIEMLMAKCGNRQSPDLVVAINLPVVEKIIDVMGGIELPDYQVTVTGDNFAEVARADRDKFFPGSQQKPNFLRHFYQQLELKFNQLSISQKWQVVKIMGRSLDSKDLQVNAPHHDGWQKMIAKVNGTGELKLPTSPSKERGTFFIQAIESNVGINKANAKITRNWQTELETAKNTVYVTTTWKNHNQLALPDETLPHNASEAAQIATSAARMHYANYHRFLIDEEASLVSLLWNEQPVEIWNEEIITLKSGARLKQIGFLIVLNEEGTGVLSASFTAPYPIKEIHWEPQSGIMDLE